MIILKDAMEKYLSKNKKSYMLNDKLEEFFILEFWSNRLDFITKLPLIEQFFIYDLVLNMNRLKIIEYPTEVYEALGKDYFRPDSTDSKYLTFFTSVYISLGEQNIYREKDKNIAIMSLLINNKRWNEGMIVFKDYKFTGTQDFALEDAVKCLTPYQDGYPGTRALIDNTEKFNIIKLANHIFDNWDCFKNCIFPKYLSESPNDWDKYSKNKIVLMLQNMLDTE